MMVVFKIMFTCVFMLMSCVSHDVEADLLLQDLDESNIPDNDVNLKNLLITMTLSIKELNLNMKEMELSKKQMEMQLQETNEQLNDAHLKLENSCVFKDELPSLVRSLTADHGSSSPITNHQRTVEQPSTSSDNSAMERIFKVLARRSCQEWLLSGFSEPGMYIIDPDGPSAGEPPFEVYCDMTTGFTFVRHDVEDEVEITPCTGPSCYSAKIPYTPSEAQIRTLINSADSCQQFIKVSCLESPLQIENTTLAWWMGRDGTHHHEWAGEDSTGHICECGLSGSCVNPRAPCNCDSGLSGVWISDSGYVTQTTALPIQEVTFGSKDEYTPLQMKYEIGPLRCHGSRRIPYPVSCVDLHLQGSHHSGWYILGHPDSLQFSYCDMESVRKSNGFSHVLRDRQPKGESVDVDVGDFLLNDLQSKGFTISENERVNQILNSYKLLEDELKLMNNEMHRINGTVMVSQHDMDQKVTEQEGKLNNIENLLQNNIDDALEYSSELETLKSKMTDVEASVSARQKGVAFFVRTVNTDWSAGAIIKFEHVNVNLGDGYDSETGVFTAPVAGIYSFSAYARIRNKRTMWFVIRRNGYFYTICRIAQNTGDLETNGSAVILTLKIGDKVDVYLGHGMVQGNPDIGGTSFMGHLIYET